VPRYHHETTKPRNHEKKLLGVFVFSRFRVFVLRLLATVVVFFLASAVRAQDEAPRIGPLVVDLHGSFPRFPSENVLLADSRDLTTVNELPGTGLGAQFALQVYVFKLRAVTIGVGGEVATARARETPVEGAAAQRAVTETFRTIDVQLSLNFGSGNGWSYLSGGIGRSNWAIVPEGAERLPGDDEVLKTINYGGGARWFAKDHLAFSFDVRFYALNPGIGISEPKTLPGSPRTTFLVIAAGISIKP
jgi:hypothetical protein